MEAISGLIGRLDWPRLVLIVKVPLHREIKAREVRQRRLIIRRRGTRSAGELQRQVSLVGGSSKWEITNLHQVAAAMAKWA